MKKILFLLILLASIVGMTIVQAAEVDENITAEIIDGGGIVTDSISISAGKITITGTTGLPEGESISYVVYKNAELKRTNLLEINETTVKEDSTFSLTFGLKANDITEAIVIELKALTQSEYAKIEMRIEDDSAILTSKIAELEELLSDCEKRGFSTDYERVKYATAKKVLQMLPVFTENGETEASEYNLDVAYKLCNEATTELKSYLDGTGEPKGVIKTETETPDIKGNSFYSNTIDKDVYYVGYGHWGASDLDMYGDLGVNLLHYEIGPSNLLKKTVPAVGWDLKEVHSNKITYCIEHSEDNGGCVTIPASSGSGQLWISQTVAVLPNTKYTFGVDFKCSLASSLRLRVGNEDKWFYDAKNDSEIANWKTATSTYTTGADETELTYSIILHNNSENLMFDNAFLKDSSGKNLLSNADFSVENTEMFTVNTSAAENIKKVFKKAEENGVSVALLTAMHYFPEYVYTYDPTIANGDVSAYPKFMPFNPTHPEVIKVINKFLDELIPLVCDSKALHSIILSNEPCFEVHKYPDYYLNEYYKMLEEKYGTVSEMNKAYGGTSYQNFNEVKMPESTDRNSSERKKLAHFNDYRLFNESIVTEYHKIIYDKITSLAPNALLHTKGMSSMNAIGTSGNRIQLGLNNEELSKFLDLNGCDAWAYYGDSKDTLMGKTMWYDYMTSVKNAPVFNSEDHILKDSKTLSRSDKELAFNMADVWQGAVHGRGATTLWLYDNSVRSKNDTGYYNANLTRRADYLAEIGKISLDLNRLSEEISAINNAKARVAILYSDSSLVLNPYALNASYVAYQQAMFGGEKVFFVNETDPTTLNKNDIELLIVPCSNYMKATTLAEIKKHIDDGGRVLLLNANGKAWMDENGNAHNTEILESVTSRSETASFSLGSDMYIYDTHSNVKNKLKEELAKLIHPINVASTNSNTEWQYAEFNNGFVINVCNYGDAATQVNISAQSEYDTENIYDLISGEKVGSSFTLSPNTPMLLRVDKVNGFEFYSIYEDGTKFGTSNLKSGKMSVTAKYKGANPNDEYTHVISVFKDGMLEQIFIERGIVALDGHISSEKEFTVDKEIDLSKCIVKTFLLDGLDQIRPYIPAQDIVR